MPRKPKYWEVREDYRPLLKRVKKLFPTIMNHVRIDRVALIGKHSRTSQHMAKICPNRRPWSLFQKDYDYLIEFWSTQFDEKPKSYRLWVTLHELAHIPEDGFKKGSKGYRKCRQHDIEDFKELRRVYGIDLEHVKDIYKGEQNLLKKRDKS